MSVSRTIADLGKPITFYPEIARFFRSVETSVFLCQFLYWRGKVGDREIYKTRGEIEHETALSHFQQREACKRLKKLGYLEIVKKGLPAKNYYRFHWDKFDLDFHRWKKSGDGGNENPSRAETEEQDLNVNPAEAATSHDTSSRSETEALDVWNPDHWCSGSCSTGDAGSCSTTSEITTEITTETTTGGKDVKGPSPDGDRPPRASPPSGHRKKPSPETAYPAMFEEAWRCYPNRSGNNPKRAAYRAWAARRKAGAAAESLLDGVIRYARYCQTTGIVSTRYVMRASTFFGPDEPYAQAWEIPPPGGGGGGGFRNQSELEAHNAAVAEAWIPPELRSDDYRVPDAPLSRNMRIALNWVPPELDDSDER
ncbi:MAG: hypothetical protein JXR29_05165 [Methylothermaceae bacterium]|nr:hypothetical protein [Methylothermaceae bacterium]